MYEIPLQVPQEHWLTLLLRCVGWAFLFYIPLPLMSSTSLWKYLLWSVDPADNLLKAYASHDRHKLNQCEPCVIMDKT